MRERGRGQVKKGQLAFFIEGNVLRMSNEETVSRNEERRKRTNERVSYSRDSRESERWERNEVIRRRGRGRVS